MRRRADAEAATRDPAISDPAIVDEGAGPPRASSYAPFQPVAQDAPQRLVPTGCGPSAPAIVLIIVAVVLVLMAIASYRNAPP